MKKSSGFASIPPPSQMSRIGGQWLTYSHMSNHYRKLLNVKPRVDSSLHKSATHVGGNNKTRVDETRSSTSTKRKTKVKEISSTSRSNCPSRTTTARTNSPKMEFDLESLGHFYENLRLDSPSFPQHYQSSSNRRDEEFHYEDDFDPKTVIEVLNFKDSSRDSAYEFSSGESRVTTRESTPEKIKLHQILPPPARPHNPVPSEGSSSLTLNTGRASPSNASTSCSCHWMKEEKYLNFLNSITDEIIARGVYTNKGLKSLFKRHLESNESFETNKIVHLLECLRCDLGIPKEESLNSLEFGYGSVHDSSGPFFFRSPEQKCENDEGNFKETASFKL